MSDPVIPYTSLARCSSAEICRRNAWQVGQALETCNPTLGESGYRIRITAIGEVCVVAVLTHVWQPLAVRQPGVAAWEFAEADWFEESLWNLSTRDWRAV